MATKTQTFSIEELAKRHAAPAWALEGLKIRMGWAAGKELVEPKFLSALRQYTQGPMCGGDK